MKKTLFIALVIVVSSATLAYAQAGSIGLFSDTLGADCNLWDNAFGLCEYYVVYVYHGGATAVQYAAPQPACLLAIYLSDGLHFPVNIGDSQNGISTGLGGCFAAPTRVLTLKFFCQMLTGPCCYYPVIPHPLSASGLIEATDCAFLTLYPTGGEGIVNSIPGCTCGTPAQETTWGKVKSLYAE